VRGTVVTKRISVINEMIKTFGLTHISLTVKNIDRAYNFYRNVFGVKEYWRDDSSIHASTPNTNDVITFVKGKKKRGKSGGILHYGFRLTDKNDIKAAIDEVRKAGGKILENGEFAPGVPYAYITDPDGYNIEIWYE
jgi:catechol 2,3-dioxygenase-like lactoylglutathione lyase family enzyme